MWHKITKYLTYFESAVLTGIDDHGYPLSVRCKPQPDHDTQTLRIELPPGICVQTGRANLHCHRHNEQLGQQKSFLLRGTLVCDEQGWSFQPERLTEGIFTGGWLAKLKLYLTTRRNARRYLESRGLRRPQVPWDTIMGFKRESKPDYLQRTEEGQKAPSGAGGRSPDWRHSHL